MSLSSEQVTEIYNLTREIMREEGIGDISLIIKPRVWKTDYSHKTRTRLGEVIAIYDRKIHLGGRMLTGSRYPNKIYYISMRDPDYNVNSIRNPRKVMLADIVASTILEEIAHAIAHKTYRRKIKPHGIEFLSVFRDLWRKHFITLLSKLQFIYGYEGISGEDYFD